MKRELRCLRHKIHIGLFINTIIIIVKTLFINIINSIIMMKLNRGLQCLCNKIHIGLFFNLIIIIVKILFINSIIIIKVLIINLIINIIIIMKRELRCLRHKIHIRLCINIIITIVNILFKNIINVIIIKVLFINIIDIINTGSFDVYVTRSTLGSLSASSIPSPTLSIVSLLIETNRELRCLRHKIHIGLFSAFALSSLNWILTNSSVEELVSYIYKY